MKTRVLATLLFCITAFLSGCPESVDAVPTPEGMVTVIRARPPIERNPLPRK
jgi:hypothetical protein